MAEKIINIVIDTREQKPLNFERFYGHGISTTTATVHTGDYTIEGYESSVAIERKSINDLVTTLLDGYEADTRKPGRRFNRTLQRMERFDLKAIVVDSPIMDLWMHKYRSLISPESVWGMVLGIFATYGVPFYFANGRDDAAKFVADLCRHYVQAREKKFFLPEDIPAAPDEEQDF